MELQYKRIWSILSLWKLKISDKILGIAPGAEYGEAKRWPVEHFAKVAIKAIDKGWKVILLGSANDHDLGRSLDSLTKNKVINLIGKTRLEEVRAYRNEGLKDQSRTSKNIVQQREREVDWIDAQTNHVKALIQMLRTTGDYTLPNLNWFEIVLYETTFI